METTQELEVFNQGAIDLLTRDELLKKIEGARSKRRPLRIKYGADPSSPDIHLGHTVPLRRLAAFQGLGHRIVFIIGDFTARIGDPSGRSEQRRILSEGKIRENARTYEKQVFKILDPKKTEVRYNSEWLKKMRPEDFLTLTSRYTVARILERDDFSKRYKKGEPIALLEFLYPLLQGYDSVIVKSDIEIGGTDQKFNLMVGRELQRDWGQEPQVVITFPIIEGTDGVQKMSKSLGNYIGIKDSPKEMFGKVMSLPDPLIIRYFSYLTDVDQEKIRDLERGMNQGEVNPREVKADLAEEITSIYHGRDKAQKARGEFDLVFKFKGVPEEIPLVAVSIGKLGGRDVEILKLLEETQLIESRSQAKRLIEQGGVKVNREKVMDPKGRVNLNGEVLIQCGKRKFARLVFRP